MACFSWSRLCGAGVSVSSLALATVLRHFVRGREPDAGRRLIPNSLRQFRAVVCRAPRRESWPRELGPQELPAGALRQGFGGRLLTIREALRYSLCYSP